MHIRQFNKHREIRAEDSIVESKNLHLARTHAKATAVVAACTGRSLIALM